MTNREKAKQIIEQVLGVQLESRLLDVFKGCDYLKNTECSMYQDCEHCSKFHFWYKKFNGSGTPQDIEKEQIIKEFKTKLRDVVEAESKRTNAEDEYIYSYSEEKLFVKLMEIIWNTNLD